jgi:hypothetical protein
MPDMAYWSSVNNCDTVANATICFAWVDDAQAGESQESVTATTYINVAENRRRG